jgi:hypothetical protein
VLSIKYKQIMIDSDTGLKKLSKLQSQGWKVIQTGLWVVVLQKQV